MYLLACKFSWALDFCCKSYGRNLFNINFFGPTIRRANYSPTTVRWELERTCSDNLTLSMLQSFDLKMLVLHPYILLKCFLKLSFLNLILNKSNLDVILTWHSEKHTCKTQSSKSFIGIRIGFLILIKFLLGKYLGNIWGQPQIFPKYFPNLNWIKIKNKFLSQKYVHQWKSRSTFLDLGWLSEHPSDQSAMVLNSGSWTWTELFFRKLSFRTWPDVICQYIFISSGNWIFRAPPPTPKKKERKQN